MSVEGDRIRVLYVDGDGDRSERAALHLERANDDFEVVNETGAAEGLERIETERIDCVVSDHDAPETDGLAFLRAVRERDERLPFVLYTDAGSEEIASEAISAGATDYLQRDATSDQYDLLADRIERGVAEMQACDDLEESERMFSTLVANLPGMVYRCRNERGWPMEFVSDGVKELTGYDAAAIEAGDVDWGSDVICEDDRQHTWERVQVAVTANKPFEVTYRITTATGETRWVWERGRPVEQTGDGTTVIEGFITDITARRTREHEFATEREFIESVINALEDIFVVVEPDGSIARWNERATEVTGYSDAEIADMSAPELFEGEAIERVIAGGTGAVNDGSTSFEARLVTADGDHIPYEFRLTTVDRRDEKPRFCGIGRDVSDRKRRERELEQYRTLVESVGDPMYVLDRAGNISMANQAMADHLGYDRSEIVGESPRAFLSEEGFENAMAAIESLLANDDREWAKFEMESLNADETRSHVEDKIAVFTDEQGEYAGSVGVIRDISERKERERRLEEFASVVSHDLRNPLEVLAGRIELARETGDVSHLEGVDRPLDRMHQLVEDLLQSAHRGEETDELHSVDLATAAEDAWRSIDTGRASLDISGSVTVEADPERLQTLLENLFRNAIDHGPGSDGTGVAEITVTVGETDHGFFVADDGVGIPGTERSSIFERGYTSQPGGTGYGLAIVEDVASAHNWDVRVTESEAGGACFEIDVRR